MRVNKIWRRQVIAILIVVVAGAGVWTSQIAQPETQTIKTSTQRELFGDSNAKAEFEKLEVKGRAPKTGYTRKQFGNGWGKINGCSVREVILARDLTDEKIDEKCRVLSGVLNDPYTGQTIHFQRGDKSSAQQLSAEEREKLANDPLNLLAVDGPANQAKGDGDTATWLPSNKPFRCQYVVRQIAVKRRYRLWVTEAEKSAMSSILEKCTEVN